MWPMVTCARLRIGYACNLLLTTNMDVVQVAYRRAITVTRTSTRSSGTS